MSWREEERAFLESDQYQTYLDERAGYANPELAANLEASFRMNPSLTPQQITGLAFGGSDIGFTEQLAIEQAKLSMRFGLGPDGNNIVNEPEEERDTGFIGDVRGFAADRIKGVSRTAFTIFDTTVELAQSSLRSLTMLDPVKLVQGKGFTDVDEELRERYGSGPVGYINFLLDIPTGTTAWVAVEQMFKGDLDMGSGYFVGGTVEAEQSSRQRDILGTIQRGDDFYAWTAGRQLARSLADSGVISEESWAWNVVSGILDAAISVVADPSNLIPGLGWGDEVVKGLKAASSAKVNKSIDLTVRANKLEAAGGSQADIIRLRTQALEELGANKKYTDPARAKNLSPEEVLLRDHYQQAMGLTGTGKNLRNINHAQFISFLTKDEGVRLIDSMVENRSAHKIQQMHSDKISARAATDLADANTREDVIAIYMRQFTQPGEDLITAVPNMGWMKNTEKGLWVRNTFNAHVKFGRMLPEDAILDPTRGTDYVATLRQLFTVLPIDVKPIKGKKFTETLTEISAGRRYIKVLEDEMLERAVRVFAKGDKAEIYDLTNDVAERLAGMFKALGFTDKHVEKLVTYRREADGYIKFAMKDLMNVGPSDNIPLRISQLISGGVAIIDPSQLQKVIRDAGRFKQIARVKSPAAKKWHTKNDEIQSLVSDLADIDLQNFDARTAKGQQINKLRKELETMRNPEQTLPISFMKYSEMAGDFAMGTLWKPLQLVRAAFVVRVVMEESLRVMASGTFGGRAGMYDYIRASFSSNSYSIDAAGRPWRELSGKADQLVNDRADLSEELANLTKARKAGAKVDPFDEDLLKRRLADFDDQIKIVKDQQFEAERFYRKALIAGDRGIAYRTMLREPKKVLYRNSQINEVDRFDSVTKDMWNEALATRLLTYYDDPIMSQLARGAPGDFILDVYGMGPRPAREWQKIAVSQEEVFAHWLMQSDIGQDALQQMSSAYKVAGKTLDPTNFDDVLKYTEKLTDEILYIVGGTRNNLGQLVDFDEGMMGVLRTGTFEGRQIVVPNAQKSTVVFDQQFLQSVDEFRLLPQTGSVVPPQKLSYLQPAKYDEVDENPLKKAVGFFFTQLYGKTSDKLARSPTFRRIYWKQMSELAEMMDPAAAQKVLESARNAGISPQLVTNLENRLKVADGIATFEEIDDIAKGAALGFTRDLLFDAAKRGATFDQMRIIIPFGDAWKEVAQTWGRLFIDKKGANLFRGMRNGRAAMGADAGPFGPGDIYGVDPLTGEYTATPDGKREPWLYTDQTSGEKRIQFPGSRQMSKLIARTGFLGEAVGDFTGVGFGIPLQNLSMAGEIMPGIGPVADRIVSDLIPDDPTFDWVREALFPFGAPADPSTPGGNEQLSDVFVPSWLKKVSAIIPEKGFFGFIGNLINDIDNDSVFLSTESQIYSSLVSTGNYETSDIGQIKAQEDARNIARKIYAFRGLLQFVGPGASLAEYIARTDEGDVLAALLTDHLRRTEDALVAQGQSPTMALPIIMDTYGPDIWLYAAPNTQAEFKGLAAKDSWWDWYRTDGNAESVKAFGSIGGFFGPDEGDFSLSAYSGMKSEGLSRQLKPKERYAIAARSLSFIAYNRVRDSLPPETQRTQMDQILLGQVRRNIEQHFNVDLQSATSVQNRKRQINQAIELIDAADRGEPLAQQLMSQPLGESLRIYLGARQRVEQMSIDTLGSANWQRSKDGAYMREFMRNLGKRLSQQDPAFRKMFQYVFDGEMFEDLEFYR